MVICRHIAYLLWRDSYVAVPGLGVFTASRRGADVTSSGISAPSVSVAFEPCANCADKALSESYARAGRLSPEESEQAVKADVEALRSAIERGEIVAIPAAGTLAADDSGDLCWTPAAESPWLPALALRPLAVHKTAAEAVDDADDALAARRESLSRSLRRTASSAAAIAILAVIVFVVSQLPQRRDSSRQIASIGIESISPVGEEPVIAAPGNPEPALVLILNTPADASGPARQRPPKLTPEQKQAAARYCLVVASLASRSEADAFIAAHSTTEMPLNILEKDGRWRVYALSAPAVDELASIARSLDIYRRYPSAWICRR